MSERTLSIAEMEHKAWLESFTANCPDLLCHHPDGFPRFGHKWGQWLDERGFESEYERRVCRRCRVIEVRRKSSAPLLIAGPLTNDPATGVEPRVKE